MSSDELVSAWEAIAAQIAALLPYVEPSARFAPAQVVEAYRAKAHRLGRSEQPEILRLDEELRAVLWARPCDLAAATRVLAEYQRLLQAEGRTA